MFRSWAPTAEAIRTKSPSFVTAAHPRYAGTPRKLVRSSSSCVKPPVAKITALRAPIRCVRPSGGARLDPGDATALDHRRCTRWLVRISTPSRSAAALNVRMAFSPPSDMDSDASRGTSTRPYGALSSGSSAQ